MPNILITILPSNALSHLWIYCLSRMPLSWIKMPIFLGKPESLSFILAPRPENPLCAWDTLLGEFLLFPLPLCKPSSICKFTSLILNWWLWAFFICEAPLSSLPLDLSVEGLLRPGVQNYFHLLKLLVKNQNNRFSELRTWFFKNLKAYTLWDQQSSTIDFTSCCIYTKTVKKEMLSFSQTIKT